MHESKPSISALVVCQNEESNIARCLESLAFCHEIILVDGGSSDATLDIAGKFTDNIFHNPYKGCNSQKEFARQKACGRWVLNLDADEWLSLEGRAEIEQVIAKPEGRSGFEIPVKTFIGERWIKRAGYWPNRKKRFFLREAGFWDTLREPHDSVKLSGDWGRFKQPIMHRTAKSVEEVVEKARINGQLAAAKRRESQNESSHLSLLAKAQTQTQALSHASWRFFRSYILKMGILEGRLGLRLALAGFWEAFEKYGGGSLKG